MAEEFGNNEMLEELWAKKAFDHAELHFNILCSVGKFYSTTAKQISTVCA